jgi:hypothetical protein
MLHSYFYHLRKLFVNKKMLIIGKSRIFKKWTAKTGKISHVFAFPL